MVFPGLSTYLTMNQGIVGGSTQPEDAGEGGGLQGGSKNIPDMATMWIEIVGAKNRLDKQDNLMQVVILIGAVMIATMLLSLLIFFIQTVRDENQQMRQSYEHEHSW